MMSRPARHTVVFLAASALALTSCSSGSDSQDAQLPASVPEVAATSENRAACEKYLQPKDFAPTGQSMAETASFYRELSFTSSGALAQAFQLVATKTTEIAPYYDADEMPPNSTMTDFQNAITTVESLCNRVLRATLATPTTLPTEPTDLRRDSASDSSIPFETERNQYWNANCPKVLRANDFLPLVKCDKGEGVRRVQEILGVEADGLFGNDTFNALLVFQKANNLPMTGEVDPETWYKLDPAQRGPGTDLNGDDLITPDEFDR